MRAIEHTLRPAQKRGATGAKLLCGSVGRTANHWCASSGKSWDTNTPGGDRNVEKRIRVGIKILHSSWPIFLQRLGNNDLKGARLRVLRGGYFVDRAIGEGASVPYRSERIRIVLEVRSMVGVIRRGLGRGPLADVKLAGLVLNLFVLRDCIQACSTGWCDWEDELRLRTSLIRRANGRPEKWESVVCDTQVLIRASVVSRASHVAISPRRR